jgi:hypothetical protein
VNSLVLRTHRSLVARLALALIVGVGSCQPEEAGLTPVDEAPHAPDIRGAWAAESYQLADGPTHPVAGRIFFDEHDWQVLFFVLDSAGAVHRGSGEGGGYELRGDSLVLTHLFNLSAGDAMGGLPESELRMNVHGEADAPEEPTRVERTGELLTLFFPSGNHMTFRRR